MKSGSTETNTVRNWWIISSILLLALALDPALAQNSSEFIEREAPRKELQVESQSRPTKKKPKKEKEAKKEKKKEEQRQQEQKETEKPEGLDRDKMEGPPEEQEPEKLTQDEKQEAKEDNEVPWHKTLNYWFGGGAGYPVSKYKMPSINMTIGINRALNHWFEIGYFGRYGFATFEDKVSFAATGYTEKRIYKVDDILLGMQFLFRLSERISIALGGGLSFMSSTLGTVETDAPVASTLQTGEKVSAPINFGALAGLQYEIPFGSFGFGVEAGYSMSSTDGTKAIQEIYSTLLIKYYCQRLTSQ